ncbi:MAG: glycosyltransferase [Pseudomonadota bacterium]|nr:glycosyltransferase [Pseudomonadota bacterium]
MADAVDSGGEMDTRLRLLVLTDTAILESGGSERFLRNLLVRLPADRYLVDVIQLCAEIPSAQIAADLNAPHIRLAYHPVGAIYRRPGFAAWSYLRRQAQAGAYDLVQSHHEKSDLIAALLPRGPRRLRKLSNRRDMGFQKTGKLRWLMRRLNRRFDRIVAPSAAIIDALERTENVEPARCICIANGVDTTRFAPADASARIRLRGALGYGEGDFLIGCVAMLIPVKRHLDLIDAFALVHAQLPQARLLLIGEGELRGEIEARIAELGLGEAVRLSGECKDVENILRTLDLFVLPSSSEGLSNAILEAQACALPVVATRVGGNPELVRDDCGLLVSPHDPAALAAALLELLRDAPRRARFGAAARERIVREHSLDAMTAAYAALHRDLVDAR